MRIGVTMGDPSGIGPELVAAALAAQGESGATDLIVFGDRAAIEAGARAMKVTLPSFELVQIDSPSPGRAQIDYLERAVAYSKSDKLDALVTAPIHKASAIAAGFIYPGHTEFLADRYHAPSVTMMFAGPKMRVSLATIHVALKDVPQVLTVENLTTTILHTAKYARRIAVAGLNPHAGEQGHFGDEEERIVLPAIEAARAQCDSQITGPHVPDVVFRDHLEGKYDAVVALYHDQGLIPVKLVDFEEAVNVTLGLPMVRTSPDHGVARDIAGRGIARTTSFFAALQLAKVMARELSGRA